MRKRWNSSENERLCWTASNCVQMTENSLRVCALLNWSNTHDNRLSPTIKCGIEGVTYNTTYVVFYGTSSSGYVVTTSRLNRCAHTHMSIPPATDAMRTDRPPLEGGVSHPAEEWLMTLSVLQPARHDDQTQPPDAAGRSTTTHT